MFKFRGLGDGTAYINEETSRLLSSYVSLYLQISFDAREKIAALRMQKPFTAQMKAQADSLAASAIKYLEIGMKQFPEEWRCYWAAGFVYDIVGDKQKALDALELGLKNVSPFDEGGLYRLKMSTEQIKNSPAKPMVIEEIAPATTDSAKDSAKVDSPTVVAAVK